MRFGVAGFGGLEESRTGSTGFPSPLNEERTMTTPTGGSRRTPTPRIQIDNHGFDLGYRPVSNADFPGPLEAILNGVSGHQRREMLRDMLAGEHRDDLIAILGPVSDDLLVERAEEAFLRTLSNSAGPTWLGGEYLPRRSVSEVEIARVVLASVLSDVISLRARWSGGRYHYRMVDEYGSDLVLCRKTSVRPLTMAQVIEVLETVEGDIETNGQGIVVCWWEQQREYGDRLEDCTAFAWVESELYPDLEGWYEAHGRAWREASEREA